MRPLTPYGKLDRRGRLLRGLLAWGVILPALVLACAGALAGLAAMGDALRGLVAVLH